MESRPKAVVKFLFFLLLGFLSSPETNGVDINAQTDGRGATTSLLPEELMVVISRLVAQKGQVTHLYF